MKTKPTKHEQEIVDALVPRPEPAPWWQRALAKLVLVVAIFRRKKGGG